MDKTAFSDTDTGNFLSESSARIVNADLENQASWRSALK
jgi:hypothetical protein